jgi:excisionase family DNA binding protein
MNQKLLSISKAADVLGVHISTLRRWEAEGKLEAVKTYGNHRRYRLIDIQKFCGEQEEQQNLIQLQQHQLLAQQQQHTLSYHRHKKKNGISTFNDNKQEKMLDFVHRARKTSFTYY